VDTLFVDEGGQFALSDALAVATSARNLVLLGDPNQLPQVSQGSHPPGAEVSVLGHLLGSDATVRPEMGVFLERTWRMRPEVNAYVSETFYEGRLEPASVTSERSVADGNGVRFLPVEHVGHSQAAPEEADAIRAEIERLVGTLYMDGGVERPLRYEDFIVVAPYNAHVRCLREKLPEAVRVGTVDKFQGQEATVSFFSMASSSGEDVPRGLEFLFSSNRLNVGLAGALPGLRGREPAAPGREPADGGADAAHQCAMPIRRALRRRLRDERLSHRFGRSFGTSVRPSHPSLGEVLRDAEQVGRVRSPRPLGRHPELDRRQAPRLLRSRRLPLLRRQLDLAEPNEARRHLDALVLPNELQSLFQR
jgi:hypothetical protein